jgi:hypothetical protein
MTSISLDQFPPPPPWKRDERKDGSVVYVNDDTGEESNEHPLTRFGAALFAPETTAAADASLDKDSGGPVDDNETLTATEHNRRHVVHNDRAGLDGFFPSSSAYQFRCTWKELGLFGDRQCFGLTIMYSVEDQKILVNFDGVDGANWQYSTLDGPYGPVDRHDLFVGSRVKLLGRTLTISSASTLAMRWIDKEYKKLLRQQEFLITKVESVGAKACVKRQLPEVVLDITRDFKGTGGRCDLRKVVNENARLGEQLAGLGLGHFIAVSKTITATGKATTGVGRGSTRK